MNKRAKNSSGRTGASDEVSDAATGMDSSYILEKQVGHLLRRAHQRASAIFAERIVDQRLTPLQYAALVKIHDLGATNQNHLGRLTAMDPATIKGVVGRLLDRALITRERDPTNQRRVLWRLTPAGAALVRRSVPRGRRITGETLAPLSKKEQALFLSLLDRIS